MPELRRPFVVGGKPFFPLGAQARNSSGYSAAEADVAFRAVEALHGNTLEIPVYWEQIEPEEGRFDLAPVQELVDGARRHGVRLILLWFATWKNGNMDYAPAWVKTHPERFARAIAPSGLPLWVLSSHCQETWRADHKALVALCGFLRAYDGDEGTVIALQLENEPGILGSDRDYGPDAQREFDGPVPRALLDRLQAAAGGPVVDRWRAAGGRDAGSWPEVFGDAAGELMTAWSIARYVDRLAESAKATLDVPMYLNVWLGEHGWRIPGETYPSGGAVSRVLDLYRWAAPHVDLIAPDIYYAGTAAFDEVCACYAREDNPLFVPESAPRGPNAWLMFRALAEHDAIGYHLFGAESILAEDGTLRPEARTIADSFRCAAAAIPLLLRYQGTGRVHAVVQEEGVTSQLLDLDGYLGLIEFGDAPASAAPKDWRHPPEGGGAPATAGLRRGRGLVVQAGPHEFYLVGADYRLHLRPKMAPRLARDAAYSVPALLRSLNAHLSVDEGYLDEDGAFHVDRRRNGDETNGGAWVEPDTGVVRVIMCPPANA